MTGKADNVSVKRKKYMQGSDAGKMGRIRRQLISVHTKRAPKRSAKLALPGSADFLMARYDLALGPET